MTVKARNLLIVVLLLGVVILPFILNRNASFGGADAAAKRTVKKLAPEYQPWFDVIWETPSKELESLLFSLQAAIGGLIIGYFLGYKRAMRAQEGS